MGMQISCTYGLAVFSTPHLCRASCGRPQSAPAPHSSHTCTNAPRRGPLPRRGYTSPAARLCAYVEHQRVSGVSGVSTSLLVAVATMALALPRAPVGYLAHLNTWAHGHTRPTRSPVSAAYLYAATSSPPSRQLPPPLQSIRC